MRRPPVDSSTYLCLYVILAGFLIGISSIAITIGVVAIATRNDPTPVDTSVFAPYCTGQAPCVAGQIGIFAQTGCLNCVNFNVSSGTFSMPLTNLTCVGTGLCPIDDSFGPDLTALSFTDSGYLTVSRVGNDVNFDVSLPSTFVQTCGATVCSSNERLSYNGSCAICVAIAAGGLPLCGACTAGQVITLGANSTCYDCVAPTPGSTALPLCGACSVGQLVTLGANSTCYDCITPFALSSLGTGKSVVVNGATGTVNSVDTDYPLASTITSNVIRISAPGVVPLCGANCPVGQTTVMSANGTCWNCVAAGGSGSSSIVSVGTNVSLVANGTLGQLYGLSPDGLVTINTVAPNVVIGVTPLVSTTGNFSDGPNIIPTAPVFQIESTAAARELRHSTYDTTSGVGIPTSSNCIPSVDWIGWRNERVLLNGPIGDPGSFAASALIIETHNILKLFLTITVTGPWYFHMNDGSSTVVLGPNGGDFVAGSGALSCNPTAAVTTSGNVWAELSNTAYASGSGAAGIYECTATWTHLSFYIP